MSIALEEVVEILSDVDILGGENKRAVVSVENGDLNFNLDGDYFARIDELFTDEFKKLERTFLPLGA